MAYQRREGGFGARTGGKSVGSGKPWERGSDGRPGGKTFMHKAVCAKCDSPCEVPFKPNGRKPVMCSNCFVRDDSRGERGGDRFGGRSERPSFDRPSYGDRPTGGDNSAALKAINDKLDKIMEILDEALADEVE
ncbi:hypothetical protein IT087_02740 [Candidatus Uhrbacteria bacterium]|nr:hypothetical protein [Candidatus Uhrbacteria bacterium]